MNQYMYIFVREDLSPAQQIVQAGHAIYDAAALNFETKSPHFVLIGAKNEQKLLELQDWLTTEHIKHATFYEPDVDQYTAIATQAISGEAREKFRKFRLLG